MSKLKLIISNPVFIQESSTPFQPTPSSTGFKVDVKNRGPHLYEMTAQDPFHHLECDLILETEENRYGNELKRMICHFPSICDEQLKEFTEEDDTLIR